MKTENPSLQIMTLEESIQKKLCSLKSTTTKFYTNTGQVFEETKDQDGQIRTKKLNISNPGYIIDEKPDLEICKVLPWLYLGAQDVAYDYNLLMQHGITHILSIGVPCPTFKDIETTYIEAYDTEDFNIEEIFDKCFNAMNRASNAGGIIFVHCNAGISRSPTVIAAYLIKYQKITHTEALNMIKTARSKIQPNSGFIKILENFCKIK